MNGILVRFLVAAVLAGGGGALIGFFVGDTVLTAILACLWGIIVGILLLRNVSNFDRSTNV